ncbi:MAG: 4Fe-4S dicluster domain-containing protein [bacterium]|nr:4Fe-4S dicluster domain-containing protein [bacterium]
MNKKKDKETGILNDIRQILNWYRRKKKDRQQGREYVFAREDFIDFSKIIHLVNWMMTRYWDKKWFKKRMHKFFGTIERPKVHSRIIPLNADVKKSPSAVIPYQLLDDLIDNACFRIILDECLCRRGMNCKDYPIDFGCLMLGEGAKTLLKGQHGKEATAEEAKEYMRKAEKHGLVPIAAHAYPEEKAMGIPKSLYHNFIEVCLCCPCCCVALKNIKYYTPEIRSNSFLNVGYVARELPDCKGCNKCVDICPAEAIKVDGDKIRIQEDICIGCGLCKYVCKYDAIELYQIGESRGGLLDYFEGIKLDLS